MASKWMKDKCQDCPSREYLQEHHLFYRRPRPEQEQDVRTLCRKCHFKTHRICERVKQEIRYKLEGLFTRSFDLHDLEELENFIEHLNIHTKTKFKDWLEALSQQENMEEEIEQEES